MARYAEPMARLIEELKKLPGVGTKTAQRFAFHILRSNEDDAAALAEAVRGLKASLRLCSVCNTSLTSIPAPTAGAPLAIIAWYVSWKSRQTSMPWSGRAGTTAFTTCFMEHSLRFTELARISFGADHWLRAWNAARSTK